VGRTGVSLVVALALSLVGVAGAATAPVAPVLKPALAKLKRQTTLPILLPSSFPHPTSTRTPTVRAFGDARGYHVGVDYCGSGGFAEACDAGSLDADAGKLLPVQYPKVRLAGGTEGRYFRPSGCGDACDRTVLWWRRQGVLYRVELRDTVATKLFGAKRLIVSVADSAISAGAR
jgi:hypothetical protein